MKEYVPDGDESITTSADDLAIVTGEGDAGDSAGVGLALNDELAVGKVVDAKDTGLSTDCEVLIGVGDGNGVELIGFAAVWA